MTLHLQLETNRQQTTDGRLLNERDSHLKILTLPGLRGMLTIWDLSMFRRHGGPLAVMMVAPRPVSH